MSTYRVRSTLAVLALMTLISSSGVAFGATPDEQAAAQALFDEGLKLLDAGQATQACPKLEESDRLDPSPSTKFQLASCYEATGRTASAWALFVGVADAARTARNAKAEEIARSRAARLTSKLPKLELNPPPGLLELPDLVVRRDGREVGRGMLGVAVPVDAGAHEVSVVARGREEARASVTVEEGKTTTLTLPMPSPAPVSAPALVPSSAVTAAPAPSAVAKSPPRTEQRSALPWIGWGGIGVGAAVAATGAVLLGTAKAAYDDAAGSCGSAIGASPDACNSQGYSQRRDAMTQGQVATWLFVGGAVLAAAGVTVLLLTPTRSAHSHSTGSTSLVVGVGTLGLRGEF